MVVITLLANPLPAKADIFGAAITLIQAGAQARQAKRDAADREKAQEAEKTGDIAGLKAALDRATARDVQRADGDYTATIAATKALEDAQARADALSNATSSTPMLCDSECIKTNDAYFRAARDETEKTAVRESARQAQRDRESARQDQIQEKARAQEAAIALAKRVAQEKRDAAKEWATTLAATPQRRADMQYSYSRCSTKLSYLDCGNARVDAVENAKIDFAQHNNLMLCADRGIEAATIMYQAQLGRSPSRFDDAELDALLGEMIDNCPSQAAAALRTRRALHGL